MEQSPRGDSIVASRVKALASPPLKSARVVELYLAQIMHPSRLLDTVTELALSVSDLS